MPPKRNKKYQRGDRINIYIGPHVNDEFIDWINMQTDLSGFFLYAAQQLFQNTGKINVSEVMPRKLNFNLNYNQPMIQNNNIPQNINIPNSNETKEESVDNNKTWDRENLDNDPYA